MKTMSLIEVNNSFNAMKLVRNIEKTINSNSQVFWIQYAVSPVVQEG